MTYLHRWNQPLGYKLDTEVIDKNISKHIALKTEEKEHFFNLLGEYTAEKNEFLQKQGEPCPNLYFVNHGTLRAFFNNPNGKESTIMFATRDWWITDMYCFLNELPAMVSIQAIEESTVLKISKKDLDDLFEAIPSFNRFFRILMQNAYCREQLRMIENLSLPAKDRYEKFISKYSWIANSVPQKHIASFLGITPEFLSTLRAIKD